MERMLRGRHLLAFARVAAILVAVTLTGAPRVLALHAPVEAHRCTCRAHDRGEHGCECGLCRRSSHAAQASDARLPACHRAAARRGLVADRRGRPDAPCVDGTCGNGGPSAPGLAGGEPFLAGPPAAHAPAILTDAPAAARAAARWRAPDPETPPPRPAAARVPRA